jgi:DNA-binding NtrC family response regulator
VAYDPTIRMLIVDDDLHVLAVLEDLFAAESGVEVTPMSDSLEALELIRRQRFDLVISDLMMPKADGLSVTRAVQETNPDTLVIIITGFASLETTLEAIHLGVYDYITKPFQIDEFRLLVTNATTRIRLERENRVLKAQLESIEGELAALQAGQSRLLSELSESRQGAPRPSAGETEADGQGQKQTVKSGAKKIGVYEKMADDYRVRLKRVREQLDSVPETRPQRKNAANG